jgi:sulfur carrier protein
MFRGMHVEVNGERRELDPGTTILGLLQRLGVAGAPVAVERNREIVPRALHESTALCDGDQLEVVQFVGGG